MAHVTADRVRDTSTTTGTGAFSVSGTAPTGYRTFSAVLSTSDTCWYAIQHQTAAEWEVGLGTYSSLNTITRTTVLASSNAGSAVNFSAGTKDIFITLAATKTVQQDNSGAVTIDANSSSAALRVTQTGAGNALVVEDSANPDATPFVVNANGVVGIGEASPSSYVSAGLVLRSSTAFTPQILAWNTTNDTSAPYWYSQKDRAGAIVNNGDALGTFLFQGYDGAAYRIAAYIGAAVDGTPGASDMPGRLVFFTTPDGSASPTERMRITNAGNVGIGTASPSEKLTVNGTVRALAFNLATNQHLIYDVDATNIGIRIGAAGPYYTIGTTGSSNLRLNNASGGDILFATSSTERMRIDSSGNVGIGQNYGLQKLTVAGQSPGANGAYATNQGSIVLNETGRNSVNDAGGFEFKASVFGSGYGAKIIGMDNGSLAFGWRANSATFTESVRIDSSGNVGIGTSSPAGQIGATGSVVIGNQANTGTSGTLRIITSGGSTYFQAGANYSSDSKGSIIFTSIFGVSEWMRIDTSGNVGIGTSSPSYKLHVVGSSSSINIYNTDGTIGNAVSYLQSGIAYAGTITNHAYGIITNNLERMRIDSSGNVGIGTTTFGTSASNVLALGNATAPTTGPADTIQIYSTDLSAGNTMLSLYTEGTPVNANATAAATHRIAIRVNGTVYYLLANTAA